MKIFKLLLSVTFIFFINYKIVYSKNLEILGLKKLSFDDLETILNNDLNKKFYSLDDVNKIIKDLYNSELIQDVSLDIFDDFYSIKIIESKLIDNIYINGNLIFKDNDLLNNLSSKKNLLFNKDNIKNDIEVIKKIYLSEGYFDISITSSYELYSENKVNLIYNINEGKPYRINKIDFIGNNFFSDRYLTDLISSRSLSFFNFLTSGSNFIPDLFDFDKKKLLSKYKEKGFFNAEINYELEEIGKSSFKLVFYIKENERLLISKIVTDVSYFEDEKFSYFYNKLDKKLEKNNYLYDLKIIEESLDEFNQTLIESNINSFSYQAMLLEEGNDFHLSLYKNPEKQLIINKINIEGNSITKDKVLRSKIELEPGDYLLSYKKKKSLRRLNNLRFVNSVRIDEIENDNLTDLNIILNENVKTGNFLLAGTFSGDTGLGFGLSLNDYNFIGSGNELKSTFNINAEEAIFDINFKHYLLNNPLISNNYRIFNKQNDLSSSFGFKTNETGIGYAIGYDFNEAINMSYGIKYILKENHSGINSNNFIQENIGNFNQFTLNYNFSYNTTNDLLYPSNGMKNQFSIEVSPDKISDDSYYKIRLINDIYIGNNEKNNFFFISNRFGLADSFDGNLKTTNAFSLGGLNFKGFDYRGLGPSNSEIYLGGNNFYTITLGHGGQFLFDKKDNINFRTFITTGSIWGSDYAANNDFKNRLSAGMSIDILTVAFPISFSYAIPIQSEDGDKKRRFNFALGTSF